MFCLTDELEMRVAGDLGQMEQLRPEWEELWRNCPQATPFQSPGWLIPWWRHLGEGSLRFLSFWHGRELCGVAPFYIYTRPQDARRQLLLLGYGNSDYLDILARAGHESAVARQTGSWLSATREEWDIAEFLPLRGGSVLLEFSLADDAAGFCDETTPEECCPVLSLPRAPEEHWSFFQQDCFTRLDYYWRRACRTGSLRIERTELESLDEALDALILFEERRWSARGQKSALTEPAVQHFHRVACYNLSAAGVLRFYTLCLDGQIIAAFYGFHHQERACFYLGGFDDRFSRLSPGKLIVAHAIEQAVSERAAVFDFLRGREAYKYDWGAVDTPAFRRALWGRRKDAAYERGASDHQPQCL